MKKKIKPILGVCFVFLMVLSLVYSTSAAGDLKALQDKYRISYNNLTKALKEGADQERIDQFSAQCKADYEEYQKALHPSSNFTDKQSVSQIKPSKTPTEPKITNQKPSNNAKKQTKDEVAIQKFLKKFNKNPKKIKIDDIEEIKKFIEKSQKQTPTTITKKSGPTKMARIKEPLADVTPITDFPELKPETNDTLEIDGINDLMQLYGLSEWCNTGSFIERLQKILIIESILPSFCQTYAKYPYIGAMGKFYFAEFRHRLWGDSENQISVDGFKNQEIYTQLSETYSNEKGNKAAVFSKIKEISDARVKVVTTLVNSFDSQIQALNAKLQDELKFFNALKNATTVDQVNNLNKTFYRIDGQNFDPRFTNLNTYIAIASLYSQIAILHLKMRNFDKADAMMQESVKLYNEIPTSIKVHSYTVQADGSEKPGGVYTHKLTRNTADYLDYFKNYIKWSAKNGEVAVDGEVAQNKVQELIQLVTEYRLDKDRDNITEEQLATVKAQIADQYTSTDGSHDNYYANKPNITKLYFTRFENVELLPGEVADPFEALNVRASIASNNPSPMYSISNIEVRAEDPDHIRTLSLKQDWICGGGYSRTFQINSRDPEHMKDNLIDVDPRQMNPEPLPEFPPDDENQPPSPPSGPVISLARSLPFSTAMETRKISKASQDRSISVAQCKSGGPGQALKVPPLLYEDGMNGGAHVYFNKALVRSYVEQMTEDVINNVCPNSKEFLMSGGGKYIQAGKKASNEEFIGSSKILVKKVANWFIIQGHGAPGSPTTIPAEDDDSIGGSGVWLKPVELYKAGGGKEYSKYEGMDVLILESCYNMSYNRYKRWRKILPKGVILGYHGEVDFPWMGDALNKLMEKLKLNSSITQEQLGTAWLEINKNMFDNLNLLEQIKGPWSYGYILPHPTDPGKNIYHSGGTRLVGSSWLRYSVPNPDITF